MSKCSVCGAVQREIGTLSMSFTNRNGDTIEIPELNTPMNDIGILTAIKGKSICNKCMDIYYTIKAIEDNVDFYCGGKTYYADGRNLE